MTIKLIKKNVAAKGSVKLGPKHSYSTEISILVYLCDVSIFVFPLQLAIKSRATDVIKGIYEAYNDILHN